LGEAANELAAEDAIAELGFEQELEQDAAVDAELVLPLLEDIHVRGIEAQGKGTGDSAGA
jgi:hypothetical protein